MCIKLKKGFRIFIYSEYVDMRVGMNGLNAYVREKMQGQIVDGDLYVFLGKSSRLLKAIFYDGTGLVMLVKRMERGVFMRLENLEEQEISYEEFDWLLRGSVIRRAKFGSIPLAKVR